MTKKLKQLRFNGTIRPMKQLDLLHHTENPVAPLTLPVTDR